MKLPLIFFLIFSTANQVFSQALEAEKWQFEAAINISGYNSLSISLEKEYTVNKFKFGPRVELLNPFGDLIYMVNDTSGFSQKAQIRLRLLQVEWSATDKIRIGAAPFWMLGPLPQRGYYKVPSSVYVHFDLDEKKTLSSEIAFTTSWEELSQISIRKTF